MTVRQRHTFEEVALENVRKEPLQQGKQQMQRLSNGRRLRIQSLWLWHSGKGSAQEMRSQEEDHMLQRHGKRVERGETV